ncbi:hypothetical protein LWE61_14915 [Sphingobium sufflavum]|uniref:hypothetical protein n=1 Tax=Sphingobium sufflavum TaxID=1129547 RepID=UPI001F1C7370|nr:hypothetical protein [Sphingobium sufflavum]MCE7797841.1 hypothetical protein [Sphingobium sufflavum]
MGGFLPNRTSGGSPRAKVLTRKVASASGVLGTLGLFGLKAPVTYAKAGGSNNLTLNVATGVISATTAIGAGNTQNINGTATGADGVVIPWSLALTAEAVVLPPPNAIVGVEVMGNLLDLAAATSPILAAGDPILLPTNGWVVKVTLADGLIPLDWSKLVVSMGKQGFANGAPTTRAYTARGTGLLRRAWSSGGNHLTFLPAGANSYYVTLDEQVHQPDVDVVFTFAAGFIEGSAQIVVNAGVVRNDSRAYPKPKVRILTPPHQRMTAAGTLDVEVTGTHRYPRAGRQWDKVEMWARVAGVDGAAAGTQVMGRSAYTPEAGRLPSGLPAASYRVAVSGAGLADGGGGIRVRVYPFVGEAWDSWVEGVAFPSALVEQELPFVRDYAGKYSAVHAWVNQDGTAGAAPAVQVGTTADPGSAASYANMATASAAIAAYNNARGGGLAHNDPDGGFIMLRDVAGSVRGGNTGAYSVRAATTGGTLVPLHIVAASGATSQLCRMRGELPDGSAPASRAISRRVEFHNIMVDSEGVSSNVNNIVVDGVTGSVVTGIANVLSHMTLWDCDIFERIGSGSANNAIWRFGFRSDVRVEHANVTGAAGITGAGYMGTWQVTQRMVGSWYHNDTIGPMMYPVFAAGCRFDNLPIGGQGQITLAGVHKVDGHVFTNVETTVDGNTSSAIALCGSEQSTVMGMGFANVFVRQAGAASQPSFRIGGDGTLSDMTNIDMHYCGSDGGFDAVTPTRAHQAKARLNVDYNDQGYLHKVAEMTLLYCAVPSFNTKTEGFYAPETPVDVPFAAGRFYPKGYLVHDGNATTASRVWYQAVAEMPLSVAGDLPNPALWKTIGQVNGIPYGRQPLRTGNWRMRHQVGHIGVVMAGDAQGNSTLGDATAFLPERNSRLGAIAINYSDWYKAATGGGALSSRGDYRPKTLAVDGVDSPLLNRVPAGRAAMPFDLYGLPRLDDGTGAAGVRERAA